MQRCVPDTMLSRSVPSEPLGMRSPTVDAIRAADTDFPVRATITRTAGAERFVAPAIVTGGDVWTGPDVSEVSDCGNEPSEPGGAGVTVIVEVDTIVVMDAVVETAVCSVVAVAENVVLVGRTVVDAATDVVVEVEDSAVVVGASVVEEVVVVGAVVVGATVVVVDVVVVVVVVVVSVVKVSTEDRETTPAWETENLNHCGVLSASCEKVVESDRDVCDGTVEGSSACVARMRASPASPTHETSPVASSAHVAADEAASDTACVPAPKETVTGAAMSTVSSLPQHFTSPPARSAQEWPDPVTTWRTVALVSAA